MFTDARFGSLTDKPLRARNMGTSVLMVQAYYGKQATLQNSSDVLIFNLVGVFVLTWERTICCDGGFKCP
jgi:hypothetical protein